ncbi:MAG: alpha/beta hydrolase-fold protein [Bacteroidota bacterium]|jgi:enterochelin esterase family protein
MKQILPIVVVTLFFTGNLSAQNYQITPGDTLHSISIASDGMTTFRIYAPKAQKVKLGGTDIPDSIRTKPMMKQENGVWDVTTGPIAPGAYRYTFIVDNVSTMDPRNPSVSESNANSWSLIYLPGADFMETKNVPHGAVAEVTYYSHSLQRFRRMHVYTPPGYEAGTVKYPVFYLLHGAFDSDNSWSTVGRAGFILDNLIAAGTAVPMIVVMPAGHTGPFVFGAPPADPARDEFTEDFLNDIKPYIEKNYRVYADRKHRAIAGLSMGGMQTLNIAIPHLDEYSAFGVFSSGIFELGGMNFMRGPGGVTWEERNKAMLDNRDLKKGLTHVWFATGKEDFLLNISQKTVDLLKKHGFDVEFHQSDGGHTWANWREYLNTFVPLLFHGTNPK